MLFQKLSKNYFLYCLLLSIIVLSLTSCGEKSYYHVKANPKEGFNYPYLLFIPKTIDSTKQNFLVVEPNNTGTTSDDLNDHLDSSENLVSNPQNMGRFVSEKLNFPLLVPVFPRPDKDWKIYTHALDRDAMIQKGNSLERIDLQLLSMVQHAQKLLDSLGIKHAKEIVLTGFSASASFANRFTAIHPTKVKVMAAGGLNSILFLPQNEKNGQVLNYPIGTNDFQSLFDKPFNFTAFKETPQFLFMGELDENDAAKYRDAYSVEEEKLIHAVLGEQLYPKRWRSSQAIYKTHKINGVIKTYTDFGHGYDEKILNDILEFIRNETL